MNDSVSSPIGMGTVAIQGKGLKAFPEELFSGKLWNLKSLLLRDNEIAQIPTSLNRLYMLTDLDLTNNQITNVREESFKTLHQLSFLVLTHNRIHNMTPFLSMTHLRALYLSDNEITTIPPGISKISSLQVLYLNNNKIVDIPKEIANLQSLSSFHISGNKVSELPQEMATMKQLSKVTLDKNEFAFPDKAIFRSTGSAYEYTVLVMRASRLKKYGWSPGRHLWLPANPRIQISFILWGMKNNVKPISLLPMEIWVMIFDILTKNINVSSLRMRPKAPSVKLLSQMRSKCTIQ